MELDIPFDALAARAPLPTLVVDGDGRIVRANPALGRLVGADPASLVGRRFDTAVPVRERSAVRALLARVVASGDAETLPDLAHGDSDSEPAAYWSYTVWTVPDTAGKSARAMVQIADTTREVRLRQEADALNEALLISGLKQHELTETAETLNLRLERALSEIYHRVRNNLQAISALVEMPVDDEEAAREHLRRIQQHVLTLVAVNELLMRQPTTPGEGLTLPARDILDRLVRLLRETSGGRLRVIAFDDIRLPAQRIAALSLVVSECVVNAVKHARGEIAVTLRAEGAQARLEVRDHGDGFPPGFNPRVAAHTGLALIDSMVGFDLRGKVRYETHPDGGGRVVVTFPWEPPEG